MAMRKKKSSGTFAWNQTRQTLARARRIVRLQKEREKERGTEGREHIQDHGVVCVCVFISTRNPLPRRRAGKKERNPARSQTNRILLQRGPLRIQHPSFVLFVFFLSISILECFQHWLAFGNRWLICVLLLLLILLVRLRFWFLVA